MKTKSILRKFFSGWLGGFFLLILIVALGFLVSSKMLTNKTYHLLLDANTQEKLESYVKSEKELSTPLMDVSELSTKMIINSSELNIKISSIQAPFSDVSNGPLSFFITTEDENNPYLLLFPNAYSNSYIELTSKMADGVIESYQKPLSINLKINDLEERPYMKIALPSNEDLDSAPLNEVLQDADFNSISKKWKKIISESALTDKDKWQKDISVYYLKRVDGTVYISHFLPLTLREFYE